MLLDYRRLCRQISVGERVCSIHVVSQSYQGGIQRRPVGRLRRLFGSHLPRRQGASVERGTGRVGGEAASSCAGRGRAVIRRPPVIPAPVGRATALDVAKAILKLRAVGVGEVAGACAVAPAALRDAGLLSWRVPGDVAAGGAGELLAPATVRRAAVAMGVERRSARGAVVGEVPLGDETGWARAENCVDAAGKATADDDHGESKEQAEAVCLHIASAVRVQKGKLHFLAKFREPVIYVRKLVLARRRF